MQRSYYLQALLAATALLSCLSPAACVMENEIRAFLEEFRKRMCHPIPGLGLPALDPLTLSERELTMDNKYIVDFTGSIDQFKLQGISDFRVDALTIQAVPLLRSTIRVTLPRTWIESLYTAKGSLAYILQLAGDGNAEASVEDFTFSISWILKSGLYLGIRGLQINMHLGGLNIDFENLLEEERVNDFFHALINELGVELLDDAWSYEQGPVVSKAETLINNFIGQYSLSDIIKLIAGGGGGEGESTPIFDGVEPNCKLDALN